MPSEVHITILDNVGRDTIIVTEGQAWWTSVSVKHDRRGSFCFRSHCRNEIPSFEARNMERGGGVWVGA
jgi:hypothetical protein